MALHDVKYALVFLLSGEELFEKAGTFHARYDKSAQSLSQIRGISGRNSMKAIAIEEYGGPEKLKLMEFPVPEPAGNEVLMRVKAAGVNPVDWKIREGRLKTRLPNSFPIIPGWDAAGVVEQTGPAAGQFRLGDEIFAYCRKPVVQHGTYAEFVAVAADSAALKPANLSFEEAASIPLAALTASQALFDAAGLKSGERVLIHAAAGGVGGFAVQLARKAGALVYGTAGARNHEYVRSLGAAEVIDYTADDYRRALPPEGVDVVFDCVGGEVLETSVDAVKEGGRLVSILGSPDAEKAASRQCAVFYVFVRPDGSRLRELAAMFEKGEMKTHISAVFPLEEASRAHRLIEEGHTRGKIVLRID